MMTDSNAGDVLAATTEERAREVLDLMTLERIEDNLYLGQNEARGTMRLFGGQVLAQAAQAATLTVADLKLHSLHAYFITAGSPDRPVLYEVERVRDGRSFGTRRVVAVQDGTAIFSMDASFQIDEPGFQHMASMPNVPPPDELDNDLDLARGQGDRLSAWAKRSRPFELRSVFPIGTEAWESDRYFNPVWIRFPERVDAQHLARVLLAYASDMGLVSTAVMPHQSAVARDTVQMASLDHALWIHRDVDLSGWLLFNKRSTVAEAARGLVHAEFFSETGELIASVTQEGLIRLPQ